MHLRQSQIIYMEFTSKRCNSATQCELERNRLSPHLNCTESPFGVSNASCFGHWSMLSDCTCGDPNYRISSQGETYWCYQDGNWNPNIYQLKCLDSCSLPQNYTFIDPLVTDPIPHGTREIMACAVGFSPNDNIVRTCMDGTFSDIPKCLSSCYRLNLTDGLVIFTPDTPDYNNGTELSFSCPSGYKLLGSTSSICLQSVWQITKEPTCKGDVRFVGIYTGIIDWHFIIMKDYY
ncbi:Complement factor H [Holothuria leucospilota]|uniref:Complement factor H n=1 Tax=Holothuria leucospilota TaxID=206669 RepID=A0A9Q0YQ90_HOLLE|nr:Complement factor H [Holothuria leucospilota]